jgi:hypothetical protein
LKNLPGLGTDSVLAYVSLFQADPFGAAAGSIGVEVEIGSSLRPRLALAEAVVKGAVVPVAARGLVLLVAGMSWMIVPFLASWVTAYIVPLLSTALATRGEGDLFEDDEEPVENAVVEDEVALLAAVKGLEATVAMVVLEDWIVEGTLMPVAAATPGAVVLAPKRATGPRLLLGEGVRVALAARRDVGKLR